MKLLVHHGANCNFTDRWGHTPLSEAVNAGHEHVATFLRSKGGKFSMRNTPAPGTQPDEDALFNTNKEDAAAAVAAGGRNGAPGA